MAKELNNLEKALSAIAKNTKAAKDTAADAKKLAAIEPAVTEAGELQYGGKTITKLITPSTLTREVGVALGGPDVANSLYKQQSNFEEFQVKEASRIALEQGVYYIEDALPEDLKEKVRTRHYEKEKNINQAEALKIVQLIQAWLDKLPSNVWISTRGGVFPLTKNVGYAPDYFGADNRIKTRGVGYGFKPGTKERIPDEVRLTLHGCQPCLAFRKFKFNTIDFTKGTFIVEEHGQDAFHLCDGSEGTRIIHAGNITTRAYLKYGYKSGADLDKMLWPPIDGWSKENPHLGTGMAEKGVAEAGFNTTTYPIVDNATYMNNSLICEGIKNFEGWFSGEQVIQYIRDEDGSRYLSAGGYWDENGVSRFPQDDGTTALTWGKWRGGQIGSRAYGWRIYGTNRTYIEYFDVRGFNGGGIVCGLYGAPDGEQVDARDSKAAYDAGIVAVNTKITGGYFTHNYICGVEAIRASGYELCGIYAPDSVVGHPDAHLEHVRGIGGTTSIDPGYQQCTSRYLPLDNVFIHDNVFGLGKRKIMDIHTGNNVKVINNSGRAMYYGVSTVIEELFASKLINPKDPRNSKDTADPYSFPYQDSNIEIRGNVIVSGLFGLHPINGASGVKFRKDAGKWWLRCHQVWSDNIVYAPRGLICNFGHNHFVIDNNQFTFALPFGTFYGLNQISDIKVTNGGSGYTSPPKVIITGGGDEAYDAKARAKIKDGKVIEIRIERVGSRYMVPPTVTIEGGGGSGATAEAYVNTFTYGMLVGAERRHGTMLGSVITRNYVQNSPEGNFARQITVGNLRGATIACNYADVTPYSSVEKAKKPFGDPYVSDSMKYRDGVGSFGFYGGALDKCEVFGNYEYDQLTDRLDVWTGSSLRGDRVVSVHSNYAPTTQQDFLDAIKQKSFEMQLEALKTELAAMKAAGTVTPSLANTPQSDSDSQGATGTSEATSEQQPPKADNGSGQGGTATAQPTTPVAPAPTTPAPVTPANPPANSDQAQSQPAAKPETSIKFTFDGVEATATEALGSNGVSKLKTENNAVRAGEPEGWVGAFAEQDGHRVMMAATSKGKGVRYIETEGVESDGTSDSAVVFPFKISAGGTDGSAYAAIVLKDSAIVNNGLVVTNEAGGFKLRANEDLTIDGKVVSPTTMYAYGKWYVAALTIKAGKDYNKIRFGINHAGNTGRNITIGAGIEFLSGDVSNANKKAEALMVKYGIE